jgi:hypothetical protein
MSLSAIYRTANINSRSVQRVRSALALSTLILGSAMGYWVLIEYVLP